MGIVHKLVNGSLRTLDDADDNILLIYIGITLVSSTCRVFLDTIEKYLFDVDYADVMKLMI